MLPAVPMCPAAEKVGGACSSQEGVVCRVMERAHADEKGIGLSAASTGFLRNEASGGVYLNVKSDPNTIAKFCHGSALPVLGDADVRGGRASFTYCPTWQREKERIEAGRRELLEEPEPEPVAMGVSSIEEIDPWTAAKRDLDILAPSEAA